MDYYILTFNGTNDAIKGENILDSKIECRIIALPEQILAGCGFVIKFNKLDKALIKKELLNKVDIGNFYKVEVKNNKKTYIKI